MKLLCSFLVMFFSAASVRAAEGFINPSEYKLQCHGSITDIEGKQEVNKYSSSINSNDWPIQFDLANYPGVNEAIWSGPIVLKSPSFQISFRTGRNTMQLQIGDLRHKPAHEYDIYSLAQAWAGLSSEYVSISYTRSLTLNGNPVNSDVFVQCVLKKK